MLSIVRFERMIPANMSAEIIAAQNVFLPERSQRDKRISMMEKIMRSRLAEMKFVNNAGRKLTHVAGSSNDAIAAYRKMKASPIRNNIDVRDMLFMIRIISG